MNHVTRRILLPAFVAALVASCFACASWEDVNEKAKAAHQAGELEEAGRLFEKALALAEKSGDDETIVAALNNLGGFERSRGDLDGAIESYERALVVREGLLAENDPELAVSYANMGLYLFEAGRMAEARDYFTRELTVRKTAGGGSTSDTAVTLNHLGLIHHQLGDREAARGHFAEAVSVIETTMAADPSLLATVLSNSAENEIALGSLDAAEAQLRDAVRILRGNDGDRSRPVARAKNSLAALLRRTGKLDEAAALHADAYEAFVTAGGDNDPEAGSTLNNIGLVYRQQGRLDEAEAAYLQALALLEGRLGATHPDLAGVLFNLGRLRAEDGRDSGADDALTRALAIYDAAGLGASPTAGRAASLLAELAERRGDSARADELRAGPAPAGPVADRVELAFRRAADAALPTGSTGVVAVSGGGDSVALLHLMARAARQRSWQLHVAHLDHAMRRGSAADGRFVATQSASLGLPCSRDRRVVGELRRRDESPEEAARRVRREFLLETAETTAATWIATGHSLDDQAETILMRLARGGGATALTGMAPSGPGPFVRPLLGIERAELRQWLERRGLAYRDDPTNRELRYDRNRIRRLVMPVLTETFNPRASANLVRAALRFREDATLLDEWAAERLESLCGTDRAGRVTLDARALQNEPGPVARRIAVAALRRAGCDPRRIGSRHVEALVDLAGGSGGRETHLPGGLMARRDRARIRIGPRREFA